MNHYCFHTLWSNLNFISRSWVQTFPRQILWLCRYVGHRLWAFWDIIFCDIRWWSWPIYVRGLFWSGFGCVGRDITLSVGWTRFRIFWFCCQESLEGLFYDNEAVVKRSCCVWSVAWERYQEMCLRCQGQYKARVVLDQTLFIRDSIWRDLGDNYEQFWYDDKVVINTY